MKVFKKKDLAIALLEATELMLASELAEGAKHIKLKVKDE